MKYPKLFLLILSFSFLSLAHAKENNRPEDYVTLANGEKLAGQVQMPLNPLNFAKVKFKEKNGKSRVLLPNDIIELKLSNGNHFRSLVHPKYTDKKLFQVIFQGEPSLLKYKKDLYVEHDAVLRKLELRSKKRQKNDLVRAQTSRYVGVLKVVFGESCGQEFYQRIEETGPYENEIKSLFEEFYQCKGVTYTSKENRTPFLVFSPLVGVSTGSMTQSVQSSFYPLSVSSIAPISPVDPGLGLNAFIDVHFQRDLPRFFLTSGLTYQSFETQMDLKFSTSNTDTRYIDRYKVTNVGIPLIANFYVFGSDNFKLHAGFGYQFRASTKEEIYVLGEKDFYGFQRERLLRTESLEPKRLDVMNNGGFLGKVGFTKKIADRFYFVGDFQVERLNRFGTLPYEVGSEFYDRLTYSILYYSINTSIKFK